MGSAVRGIVPAALPPTAILDLSMVVGSTVPVGNSTVMVPAPGVRAALTLKVTTHEAPALTLEDEGVKSTFWIPVAVGTGVDVGRGVGVGTGVAVGTGTAVAVGGGVGVGRTGIGVGVCV